MQTPSVSSNPFEDIRSDEEEEEAEAEQDGEEVAFVDPELGDRLPADSDDDDPYTFGYPSSIAEEALKTREWGLHHKIRSSILPVPHLLHHNDTDITLFITAFYYHQKVVFELSVVPAGQCRQLLITAFPLSQLKLSKRFCWIT